MSLNFLSLDLLVIIPVTVLAFVSLLTIIVFFHEYGHFSMARLLGVRVDIFSIGFGKPIARWIDRKGTEWRIAPWPLGGYVKFFGDASPASNPDVEALGGETGNGPATTQFPKPGEGAGAGAGMTPEERAVCFHFKPVWARAAIVAAGPIANFILAIALFWGLLMAFGASSVEPRVGSVLEGSAADVAGFMPGDIIISANGRQIREFDDLQLVVKLNAGEPLDVLVDRNGERLSLIATPRRQETVDAFGNPVFVGVLGITSAEGAARFIKLGAGEALARAAGNVTDIIGATVKFLSRLILGKEDARQLGGPVKMAQYASQSAMSGFGETEGEGPGLGRRLQISLANFINLAAVVSVSIGFINLLPIPVLDGGHLMYYAYEGIAGKPLGARAQALGFRVGIVLLASFMIFATWNDIANLFSQYS